MKEQNIINAVKEITMPQEMKEKLFDNCKKKSRTKNILFRHSRLIASAAIAMVFLVTVSLPAYAAYDLYNTKNIEVFFEKGISQEQIDMIGDTLSGMDGVYAIRFISADEAWDTFSGKYLTEELIASFTENPLADSFSYRVTVSLSADTKEIRSRIEQLEGVRKTSNLYELDERP